MEETTQRYRLYATTAVTRDLYVRIRTLFPMTEI